MSEKAKEEKKVTVSSEKEQEKKEEAGERKPNEKTASAEPKPINPAKDIGDYAIITESRGQRRMFLIKGGTVQIVPESALSGTFELK